MASGDVVCTVVFGTHVVCACVRVCSLPGGLLPSQHRRRSIVFRVLFQQTNKQTNKVNSVSGTREGAYCRALPCGRHQNKGVIIAQSISVYPLATVGDDLQSMDRFPASKHPIMHTTPLLVGRQSPFLPTKSFMVLPLPLSETNTWHRGTIFIGLGRDLYWACC